LIRHLHALTDQNERAFEKRWSIDDAPKGYIEALGKAIVGIELAIDVIEGKWKVSQNRSESDKQGAVAGLRAIGCSESINMAQLVAERITK
jgi:transcriptional regulator